MITYHPLSQQTYEDLLLSMISLAEGHLLKATDLKDKQITIGYGYTFGRDNNLALWQAAQISLTAAQISILQQIDSAPPGNGVGQKNYIALTFTKSLTTDEAVALLRQTYTQYESPAESLGMPFSTERAALVSLTYNRGVGNVNSKMKPFFDAVRNDDTPI